MLLPRLVTVTLTSIWRTSESRTGCGETWRLRIRPRNLRFPYLGKTSVEENGCSIRLKNPRFFMVVVVIGAGVPTGAVEDAGVADGVAVARVSTIDSCARRPAAAKIRL